MIEEYRWLNCGDRKIICSGFAYNGQDWDFGLVRYLPDGSLDSGFGVGGKLITAIGKRKMRLPKCIGHTN
ncbi:MAG: hypothetical protein IPL25_13870 [Saprospiraceae bacterium]|nr:hypothetical protein [Candidatus Vicinibacter affinis]